MSETKSYQLVKVAKELNVGISHLIEKLDEKGHKGIPSSPGYKITNEQYEILCNAFAGDRADKIKAEKIVLSHIRRQDEEDAKMFADLQVPKPESKPEVAKEEEISLPVEEIKITTPEPEQPQTKEPEAEVEKVKRTTATLEGFKTVGTIDLDAEKKAKAAEKSKKEAEKPTPKEKPVPPTKPAPEPIVEAKPVIKPKEEEKQPELVERKKVTIQGITNTGQTIDLDKLKDAGKPGNKQNNDRRERKKIVNKDKRINVDEEAKKQNGPQTSNQNNNNNNNNRRPSNQQGGGGNRNFQNNRNNNFNKKGNNTKPQTDETISEEEIQNKIKETMAKLSGGGGSNKSKPKPKSRQHENFSEEDTNVLELTEFITVSELASLMDKQPAEVIGTCFKLGVMVSINQRLDAELIELVAGEFGYEIKFLSIEEQDDKELDEDEDDDENALIERPSIVTIMGHVDHGKTSLLDYIRKANVVSGEAGGITQHIGAYEVKWKNNKRITFLDTPGHEAFTAMRARGAKLTDIAVIVVAADDAVMPQTKEAISHAQAAGVPIIIAINKIDKDGANSEKIKEQLSQLNIMVEDWGGNVQCQEISAKKGLNIDLLLDKILLESEILALKANPNKEAVGSVIEASLDKGRGFVVNIMVQSGTLKQGDMIVAGSNFGRAKAMFNEHGLRIEEAGPSTPVSVLGLNGAPQAGDKFKVYDDESQAKAVAAKRLQLQRELGIRAHKHITLEEIGRRLALGNFKELKLIVKGDVDGSVEALSDSLIKLSTESIKVSVISKSVGQVSEADVMLASASDAIIIGFNVRPSVQARKTAEKEDIEIRNYSIIYDAINDVKQAMEGLMEPKFEEKVVCQIEIREVFKVSKVGTIAGCYVQEGKVNRNTKIRIIRDGIVIHTGELASLKRYKDDVKEVGVQMECGLNIKNFNDIEVGDIIEGYDEVQVKNKL